MQNKHKVMRGLANVGREKGQHKGWPEQAEDAWRAQAIETAMNASKNIKTAPAKGKTIGIIGTMESIGSSSTAGTSWACASWLEWSAGLDMAAPGYFEKLI
jgi:sugar (pentulose or hexulose) kinase